MGILWYQAIGCLQPTQCDLGRARLNGAENSFGDDSKNRCLAILVISQEASLLTGVGVSLHSGFIDRQHIDPPASGGQWAPGKGTPRPSGDPFGVKGFRRGRGYGFPPPTDRRPDQHHTPPPPATYPGGVARQGGGGGDAHKTLFSKTVIFRHFQNPGI